MGVAQSLRARVTALKPLVPLTCPFWGYHGHLFEPPNGFLLEAPSLCAPGGGDVFGVGLRPVPASELQPGRAAGDRRHYVESAPCGPSGDGAA